jgi:hypothetical protein
MFVSWRGIIAHPIDERMKQMTAFLCAWFVLTSLQAQSIKDNEVPATVIHKFSFIYPDATRVTWQLNQEKYQADFKNEKKKTTAVFMSDGVLYGTKTEIKVYALPEAAIGFLTKEQPDNKIEQANILEDENGMITFNAVVDKTEFIFDRTGQLLISSTLATNAQE